MVPLVGIGILDTKHPKVIFDLSVDSSVIGAHPH